tara:strand:- start:267 stop:626 length:360 start_codon:yes stop_codon:yes gene_type:complete
MATIRVVPLKRGFRDLILHKSIEKLREDGVTTVSGLKKTFIIEKQLISNKLKGIGSNHTNRNINSDIVGVLAKKIRLIHNGVLLGNAHSLLKIDLNLSDVLHLVFDSSDCITINDRIRY